MIIYLSIVYLKSLFHVRYIFSFVLSFYDFNSSCTTRGRQWTGEYVMEFRDLINSATTKAASGTEEARFSFLQGGYMEDFQPQGTHSSG